MDIGLKQRLDLLEKTKQINGDTVKALENFIKVVEDRLNIKITEENGSMLVTHIALAISRIEKGEEIVALEDSLLKELKSSPNYEIIPSLIEELEKELDINIPESEYGYIGLHLGILENNN